MRAVVKLKQVAPQHSTVLICDPMLTVTVTEIAELTLVG